jgi:large subunit ribosomal protein L10
MPNAQNKETVKKIEETLASSKALWVVDYRGLSVKQVEELRGKVRDAGASMVVYKNTLMSLALANQKLPTLDDILAGPSAFVFAAEDPAAAAKAVKTFADDNDALQIKGGIMDGDALDASQVEVIASLPSREELYAQIAQLINATARSLATTINAVPQNLAQAIKQVAEQKPAA